MAKHISNVNFRNLIRDLAEMYPFDVTEVVLIELIANSLDAKASLIKIEFDAKKKILIVQDNGAGMNASQFSEYHDFAAGLKKRGTGIGFAGLGAKISFNVADRVITETKSKSFSGGSDWYLRSQKELFWDDIKSIRLRTQGTRVEVRFRKETRVTYASNDDLVRLLRCHYLPLMETRFLDLYQSLGLYSKDLKFEINGCPIKSREITSEYPFDNVKEFFPMRSGKRFGYGFFGLAKNEYPLSQDICGVLLSTHGKIIKTDFFNQFPGSIGPRIFGVVEVPDFIKFLTTSKTDFARVGRHKEFEQLYNPIRQEFKIWLKEIGAEQVEILSTDESARLEKELRKIINDIPELSEFFGFRAKKQLLQPVTSGAVPATVYPGIDPTFPLGKGAKGAGPGFPDIGDKPGQTLVENPKNGPERAKPISRSAKRGPKIAFIQAPDRVDLAWVNGNNIVVNSGHPAYQKGPVGSLSRRLHCLFSIASAIQRFLGTESEKPDLMFVDRMMAAWGEK